MDKSFIAIKNESDKLGLSVNSIAKVIQLIEYAKQNNVEIYVKEGKLKMRKKDFKSKNPFGDSLSDIFGGRFGK